MANRNYEYSHRSKRFIKSTLPEMQAVANRAMEIANTRKLFCPDFGISRGYSSPEEQNDLYQIGRSEPGSIVTNCDGYNIPSPHQSKVALDFYAYVDGNASYEPGDLALVATCFCEAASDLGYEYDWGGNFRSLADGAHFEIILP